MGSKIQAIREFQKESLPKLLLLISGYTLLLPILLFIVFINETARFGINFFLNYNTPYILAKGGRKTIPYTGEMEGRGAGLCFLASEPEDDLDVEKEIRWISSRLFTNGKGPGPFELLKSTFITRFGYCTMKRMDNFDIRRHISIYEDTTSRVVDEKELLQNIIPALMTPFDCKVKPPWEWIILPKVLLNGKLQTVRMLRIHWAYGDGYSLFSLLSSLLEFKGCKSERNIPFVFNPWKPLGLKGKLRIWWIWTKALFRLPFELAKNVFLSEEHLLGEKDPFSQKARPQSLSCYKYWISPELGVSELKSCAKGLGMDTTSTIVTAYRNAVGRVCREKGLVEKGYNRLAYCTSLLLPVRRKWGLENQTFEIEEEIPLFSLESVKQKSVESRLEGIWWRYVENWLDRMPCMVMQWVLNSSFYEGVKISTYLANAPFTREKGIWRGKMVNTLGFFEADGSPISITAIACSYGEGFRIYSSANSSLEISKHMGLVFKYLEEEIKYSFRKPATA